MKLRKMSGAKFGTNGRLQHSVALTFFLIESLFIEAPSSNLYISYALLNWLLLSRLSSNLYLESSGGYEIALQIVRFEETRLIRRGEGQRWIKKAKRLISNIFRSATKEIHINRKSRAPSFIIIQSFRLLMKWVFIHWLLISRLSSNRPVGVELFHNLLLSWVYSTG